MNTWTDVVGDNSIGTSTAQTELSGDLSGSAKDYIVPSPAQTLVAVRPRIWETTPTANQAVVATLNITSKSNYVGDMDIIANPLGSGLGTNENQYLDGARWYPINLAVKANSAINFSGWAQIANAVAPRMGVDLLLSDAPPNGPAIHYITNGQAYGFNNTSTGTSAATVTGNSITVSGSTPVTIKAFYGVTTATTPAASKPFGGWFTFSSPSFQTFPNPQRLGQEPITGFLGTTTAGDVTRLSQVEGLNLVVSKMPATITTTYTLSVAVTTAGNFMNGLAYSYNQGPPGQ